LGRSAAFGRQGFITLAALALMVQILVPRGFMVTSATAGPSLVICTGHGPLVLAAGPGKPGKAPRPDTPCAFAIHGGAGAPLVPLLGLAARIECAAIISTAVSDLAPGRGLAAPPPPSQAPPVHLI
jgi:hypothetical protein